MAIGTMASVGGFLLSGVAYNRDGYANNVQMKQTQMYQEKNYYITWIAAVREEVRDIMTIFVGRMSNYNVVSTLMAAIVAGAICEGEPADSCPDFVVHAFYFSMYSSGMYLFMSVMYAARGMTVAYKSGMAFLVAVVPDPLDKYDHDYMMQVTKNFERDVSQVFRIPLIDLFRAGQVRKRQKPFTSAVPTEMRGKDAGVAYSEELLERLPRGCGEPMGSVALRAAAAAGLQGSCERRTAAQVQEAADEERPLQRSCDGGVSHASYFESLRMYSELWEPFAMAAEESLAHGVLSLAHGSIYYCLGRLYDRSERWAALTILGMFVILATVMFCDGGISGILCRDASRAPQIAEGAAADSDHDHHRRSHGTHCWEVLVLLLVVAGPLSCAVADRSALPWMDLVFIPLSYMFHVCLALTFSISAFRCTFRGLDLRWITRGAWHRAPSGAKTQEEETELGSAAQEMPSSSHASCMEMGWKPSKEAATASASTASLSSDAKGCTAQPCTDPAAVRADPERLLSDLLERSRLEIRRNLKMLTVSSGLVHAIVALAWVSILFWALVVRVAHSDVFRPLAAVEEIPVDWPSPHFRPTALACAKGHVFVADRFGIYELTNGSLMPTKCNLTESVVDVAAACEGPRCWPLALTGGGAAAIANCSSGTSAPLLQTPAEPEHVASFGSSGDLAALRGGELLQYRWAPERHGYRPLWPLSKVHAEMLRAIDVIEDADGSRRLVSFRGRDSPLEGATSAKPGHRATRRRPEATVEVEVVDTAAGGVLGPSSYSFRLPHRLPPLKGGCVADGQSLLVLTQGEAGRPVLGRLRVNISAGTLL